MAAVETIRPDEDVNSLWSGTTVANIDDDVLDPTPGDGSVCRALTADDGEAQIFGFPAASGVDDDDATVTWDHATVFRVKLYCKTVIDTAVTVNVRFRPNADAAWTLYQSFASTTTYAWQTCTFAMPAVLLADVEPQVEVMPSGISGLGASFDIDALYVQALGVSLTTANSALTKPEDSCFEMLAEDDGVQAWLGAASSTEAGTRIYFEWNAPGEELFFESCPFIVISHTQPAQWNKAYVGTQNWLRPSGAVSIAVFDRDRFPEDIGASRIAFKNFVADCELALVNRAGANNDLSINSLSPLADTERSEPEKDDAMNGGLWTAAFQALWGDV